MNSASNYVGQEIAGRYRLESLLGVGSFGPVYAARDDKARLAVTLRLLRVEMGGDSAFDATALTEFRHPQAVAVIDVGGFEDSRYIVMPRASGTRIQVREPWPFERVLDFVRQVSAPLIAFHKQFDLQHLHLHPGNMFVEETSGKLQFQVADLGLASQVGARPLILEAIRERRTTPEFLSPEQLQGNVPSSQSDVYAFGAMLFQLLSGSPPFPYSGESLSSYALHVAKSPPPRFRDVSDQLNVDSYLESIILRCLSKSPEGRPGSIQEFVESYEMAYRDFQTRTLSGLKLSQLEEPRPNEFRGSNPLAPANQASPGTRVSVDLPASDMLPDSTRQPTRKPEIPYQALPHGTDTVVGMPSGTAASRAVMQESQAILQTVNPQLSPWSGMGGDASAPVPSQLSARSEAVAAIPEPLPKPPPRPENRSSFEQSLGTMSPNVPHDQFATAGEQFRRETPSAPPSATFQRSSESELDQSISASSVAAGSRTPRGTDQTMSPSSGPIPQSPSDFGGQADSNLTMQMQHDWLRSQLPSAAPNPIVSTSSLVRRSATKTSGPPKVVLVLLVAILLAAGGSVFYGRLEVQRVRKLVDGLVGKAEYNEAKTAFRQIHPLATVWLNRDDEIQQLLTDGLKRVEQHRKAGKPSDAVWLAGQLDLAFAEKSLKESEKPLKDWDKPHHIRQEIAKELQGDVVRLAGQQLIKKALEEVEGDVARAFQKVAKKLSTEKSDFDVTTAKQKIFRKGLELAKERTDEGRHAAAYEVLDLWLKEFRKVDEIADSDKDELKTRHCEARVNKTLLEAHEEVRRGLERCPQAISMLDNLLGDLGGGSCSQRRPTVLLARGQLLLKWAETKTGSETDIGKRFDESWKDLTAALNELEKQSSDVSTSQSPPTKAEILQSRAAMQLARGRWHELRVSIDMPTQPLLAAVRDFKAALVDVPNFEDAQRRLMEIRENAQSRAYEAFQSAREEPNRAMADEHFCDADRQFTLVIEAALSREDDGLAQYARLQRGLARSSLRDPDYSNAIADLTKATAQATELRLAEIGEKQLPGTDPQDRDFQMQYMFAVGRSRLAWLIATCPHEDIRKEAKETVKANEQARLAVATLEGMIDKINPQDVQRDNLRKDACYAHKALAVAWLDLGEFLKARLEVRTLQGSLDRKAKGWESDERNALENLLQNYIEPGIPYRVAPPMGTARQCPEK